MLWLNLDGGTRWIVQPVLFSAMTWAWASSAGRTTVTMRRATPTTPGPARCCPSSSWGGLEQRCAPRQVEVGGVGRRRTRWVAEAGCSARQAPAPSSATACGWNRPRASSPLGRNGARDSLVLLLRLSSNGTLTFRPKQAAPRGHSGSRVLGGVEEDVVECANPSCVLGRPRPSSRVATSSFSSVFACVSLVLGPRKGK